VPYTFAARASLGSPISRVGDGPFREILLRPLSEVIRRVSLGLGASDDELDRRLEQAGLTHEVAAAGRVAEYRLRVVGRALFGVGVGGVAGAVLPVSTSMTLLLVVLGGVVGASRLRAQVDRRIRERQERLRLELATAAQLLALTVRVGGGVTQALQRFVDRGHGLLASEMREVLAQHAGGVPIADALRHAADRTPEPSVARTHRMLAAGVVHGSDLAGALLAHSDEIRAARRESLRREAVRRRAAMLLPTIAVLAPVMLLFVAAPLPSIVTGAH
jgi:pilus assembly protein TadC